jgi:hypothetical protein
MADTILERHYRDRMQSVRQIAAREGAQAALSWRDCEDLVALCFELSAAGQQLLKAEYNRLFKEPNLTVAWLQERRRVIEELSDTFLQLAESIKSSICQACQTAGSPAEVDVVARLDSAVQILAEEKQCILERWPVGSPREIAEARSAIARGEGLAAEAAFAQIAGVDVETWRKRVEDYKQTRHD